MITYLKNLKIEEREAVRETLKILKKNMLNQNELYFNLLMKPNENLIKAIEETLSNRLSIDNLNQKADIRNKRMKEVKKELNINF